MKKSPFWEDISVDFNTWAMALDRLNLPSPGELDRYWASLTADGEIDSSLKFRVQGNFTLCPGGEDRQEAIRESISVIKDSKIISHIESGIENETFSPDFFWSWTAYQRAVAVLLVLEATDDEARKDFNQKSSQKSAIVQQYIYAYWMYERWAKPSKDGKPLEKNAHGKAQDDLAKEIDKLLKATELLPIEKQWLESMVRYEGKDPYLKGKIVNLTSTDICAIIKRGGLQKDELPPLPY